MTPIIDGQKINRRHFRIGDRVALKVPGKTMIGEEFGFDGVVCRVENSRCRTKYIGVGWDTVVNKLTWHKPKELQFREDARPFAEVR